MHLTDSPGVRASGAGGSESLKFTMEAQRGVAAPKTLPPQRTQRSQRKRREKRILPMDTTESCPRVARYALFRHSFCAWQSGEVLDVGKQLAINGMLETRFSME